MGYLCDFCGDQRSMVYCRSDAACLCLSCDRNVHSANALSRRHSRTLICERCNLQAATVRCVEERVSLCQNCDWNGHGTSTSDSSHKRQSINCYSGCPSAAELSSIWSFVSDLPSVNDACEQELGLMSIAENDTRGPWSTSENNTVQKMIKLADVSDVCSREKSDIWVGSSSMSDFGCRPHNSDHPVELVNVDLPKFFCPGTKVSGLCSDDDLCKEFDMDEMSLNLENYDELFGVGLNQSEDFFENGGIDSLFESKDMSIADSVFQGAVAAEGSSVELVKPMPACSNGASADSVLSTRTEPILCFNSRPAQSGVSFSGLTGESSAVDFQDCGATSMLLMGEPPWCIPGPDNSIPSTDRNNAVLRYKEKKKSRKFEKRVRYATRKARADVRKREKGRFVKAGQAYDYDPLSRTRSY